MLGRKFCNLIHKTIQKFPESLDFEMRKGKKESIVISVVAGTI